MLLAICRLFFADGCQTVTIVLRKPVYTSGRNGGASRVMKNAVTIVLSISRDWKAKRC